MCNIPLWLTTSHIWSFQSGTITFSSTLFWIQSCVANNQHIWLHHTVTYKSQTYPNNKGLASLQNNFWITPYMSFDVTLPFNMTNSTCNISYQILVSHHPDDVIIVSSCSPLDAKLNDEFIQPPEDQTLQLISNIKHRHTRPISAIW